MVATIIIIVVTLAAIGMAVMDAVNATIAQLETIVMEMAFGDVLQVGFVVVISLLNQNDLF